MCLSSLAPRRYRRDRYGINQHDLTVRNASAVVVALSGGVDSSVAAALLQRQLVPKPDQHDNHSFPKGNHEMDGASRHSTTTAPTKSLAPMLHAVHMTNWSFQDEDEIQRVENVCYEQDYKDAACVAEYLQLPLIRQRLEAEYWTHVFEPYLDDLIQNGNMGNPDINCNVHVKFGALRENVLQRYGPETWLATGHYARLWHPQLNDKSRPTTTESLPPVTLQNYSSLIEQNLSLEDDDWLWRFHSRCQSGDTLTPWLLGAADLTKDQSYFLAGCKGSQLRQVLFPLGDLYKKSPPRTSTQQNLDQADQDTAAAPIEREDAAKTVREIAAELNLPTANKRESMGICFIGKRKSWKQFVQDYVPRAERKVDFVDIDSGKVLAQSDEPSHPAFYTAGQGARLSGTPEKYFVVGPVSSPPSVLLASSSTRITSNDSVMPQSKEERNNVVWICAGTQHPALFAKHFTVHSFNWILETVPEPLLKLGGVLRCQCRIRHLQRLANCEVVRTENSEGRDGHYTIHLEEPMRGIMPGQMLVLYAANGLVCLGGGPITSRGPSLWEQNKMHKV